MHDRELRPMSSPYLGKKGPCLGPWALENTFLHLSGSDPPVGKKRVGQKGVWLLRVLIYHLDHTLGTWHRKSLLLWPRAHFPDCWPIPSQGHLIINIHTPTPKRFQKVEVLEVYMEFGIQAGISTRGPAGLCSTNKDGQGGDGGSRSEAHVHPSRASRCSTELLGVPEFRFKCGLPECYNLFLSK